MIFLPGQADLHYQHMTHVTGTIRLGDDSSGVGAHTYVVDGRGGKDHSWGPRYWQAPWYYRWLTANVNEQFGFMASREASI